MEKKMTKKEMFAMVKGVVEVSENENKEEMIAFIDHEVELLEKKAGSKKETATQKANEGIMSTMLEVMATADKPVTITTLQGMSDTLGTLSNQKVSALMRKLVENGSVVKVVDKKTSLFRIA